MTSRCRKPDYINEEIALTAFKIEYYMFLTAVLGSNLMIQCFVLGLNRKSSSDIDYGYFFFACAIPAISVVIIMIVRRVLKKFAKSAYWQLRFVSYLLLFLGIGLRTDRKAILSEVPYREAGITNVSTVLSYLG